MPKAQIPHFLRVSSPLGYSASLATELQGPPCNCCPTCECGGYWFAEVQTKEPALQNVAITNVMLSWSSTFVHAESNECDLSGWTASYSCWANPDVQLPGPFNTHWYVADCYAMDEDYPHDDRYARSQRNGIYYNYDFGDPDLVTWIDDSAYAAVSGNSVDAGWWHHDDGEAAVLLVGRFLDFGYNSCVM